MKFNEIRDTLTLGGIDDADADARGLLSHFFGATRADILLYPERDYASRELDAAIARRMAGEPIQYITGVAYFYNEKYKVSPDCLIPRSDTEVIVERACRDLKVGARFADLCTGSGCIAISTLSNRRDTTAVLVDISGGALALAKENAEENGVYDRCEFLLADVTQRRCAHGCFDAIISNPPYIESRVIDTLSREVLHEPRLALDGGEDGLDFYRCIINNYACALTSDGFFLFEIGYDQGDAIARLAEEAGFACEIFPDLAGRDRGAKLWRIT